MAVNAGAQYSVFVLIFHSHTGHYMQVFAHKETCSEETAVETRVKRNLAILEGGSKLGVRLDFVWGGTLYHLDDLPFSPTELPDVYTQFRKVYTINFQNRLRSFSCYLFAV